MKLHKIVCNLSGITRYDTMEERKFLVAPMIMMVEGVHNGNGGPLYYPADELAKAPASWNMKPVVVAHPDAPTACDPIILTNRKVGVIMNTTYVDGKLKAEAWLEVDRCAKVDDRIISSIENKEVMELSTGLFTDEFEEAGNWNGENYTAVARNFKPDHLALLPDTKGACSVADGAGFMRVNEEGTKYEVPARFVKDFCGVVEKAGDMFAGLLVGNEMGHDALRSTLSSLIGDDAWVEEVYEKFFIYEKGGDLYRQDYTGTDENVALDGLVEEVVRVIEYRTPSGLFVGNERKEIEMKKEKLVAALIANEATQWADADKEVLMGMDEAHLEKMVPIENEVDEQAQAKVDEAAKVLADAAAEADAAAIANAEKPVTVGEYIANAPTEMQAVLNSGLRSYQAQKTRLIGLITANTASTFSKEQLEAKDVEELIVLARLASTKTPAETEQIVNYAGQGDVNQNEADEEEDEEPLEMARCNFDAAGK